MVGNEVVAAIERRAKEYRFNLHRGGMATVAADATRSGPLPSRQRKLSLDAAGVDIYALAAAGDGGECLPGLEGVETTTGVDVAGKMIALTPGDAGNSV